jgi:hypothetical protein
MAAASTDRTLCGAHIDEIVAVFDKPRPSVAGATRNKPAGKPQRKR